MRSFKRDRLRTCVDLSLAFGSPGTFEMLQRYSERVNFTSSQICSSLFLQRCEATAKQRTETKCKVLNILYLVGFMKTVIYTFP